MSTVPATPAAEPAGCGSLAPSGVRACNRPHTAEGECVSQLHPEGINCEIWPKEPADGYDIREGQIWRHLDSKKSVRITGLYGQRISGRLYTGVNGRRVHPKVCEWDREIFVDNYRPDEAQTEFDGVTRAGLIAEIARLRAAVPVVSS